jgi:tetratricopeptide (TPR) repeat protein
MRKIVVPIFLVLTFLCSPAMSETAADWFNKAIALSDGKKFTDPHKAIVYLSNAIKLQPNDAEIYYNRGVAFANLGQYQTAIKDYNQTISLNPAYSEAFYNRGTIYSEIGQYQRAIEDFNQAISLQPNDAEAYHGRGFAYDKLGQYQRAIEDYNQAINLQPNYANAYNNRGISFLSHGNKTLGCFDAQRACALGNCKLLEMAKDKGFCP